MSRGDRHWKQTMTKEKFRCIWLFPELRETKLHRFVIETLSATHDLRVWQQQIEGNKYYKNDKKIQKKHKTVLRGPSSTAP